MDASSESIEFNPRPSQTVPARPRLGGPAVVIFASLLVVIGVLAAASYRAAVCASTEGSLLGVIAPLARISGVDSSVSVSTPVIIGDVQVGVVKAVVFFQASHTRAGRPQRLARDFTAIADTPDPTRLYVVRLAPGRSLPESTLLSSAAQFGRAGDRFVIRLGPRTRQLQSALRGHVVMRGGATYVALYGEQVTPADK